MQAVDPRHDAPLRRVHRLDVGAGEAVAFDELVAAGEPVVLAGLASAWPLVRAGRRSAVDAAALLLDAYRGGPVLAYTGAPEINGRFHYTDDVTGLNFQSERLSFPDLVAALLDGDPEGSLYMGSTDLASHFPDLLPTHGLLAGDGTFARHPPRINLWLGNRTSAAAHFDTSNNVACCVVGRRRFTLFPPEQVANLYPGPIAPTPGGQIVTMVDVARPDHDRFPGFAAALAEARVADLEPGDVIVFPALWWHQVEALDPFNVLINFWWTGAAPFHDNPMNTILHGMLSLRDRPDAEKRAWRALFDYYLFGDADRPAAHLPAAAQGPLAPLDSAGARRLRAHLLNQLNR